MLEAFKAAVNVVEEVKFFNTSVIKEVVSPGSMVTYRQNHGNLHVTGYVQTKLFSACNNVPLAQNDNALLKRMQLVPLRQIIGTQATPYDSSFRWLEPHECHRLLHLMLTNDPLLNRLTHNVLSGSTSESTDDNKLTRSVECAYASEFKSWIKNARSIDIIVGTHSMSRENALRDNDSKEASSWRRLGNSVDTPINPLLGASATATAEDDDDAGKNLSFTRVVPLPFLFFNKRYSTSIDL